MWSGLVHSAVFFLIGIKLWSFGKRYGYNTQSQFFKDRFDSKALGYMLFPVLIGLIIPYLLIGVIAGGGALSEISEGKISPKWASAIICGIVLIYVFFGGMRGTTWANAMQTLIFMITGIIAFYLIYSFRVEEEEQQLVDYFGNSYRDYKKSTGRIFPKFNLKGSE